MDDIQREFLDIVSQVKAHLEYRRALGMSFVEMASSGDSRSAAPVASKADPVKTVSSLVEKPFVSQSSGLAAVREELGDCTRCKLHKGRKNLVFGEGDPNAALVFVGEGPGQEEDLQGRPFVGAAGQLLTDIIVKGMQLKREDVYICNIVKCRPPGNRNPEPDEIEACEPFLIKQLQAINPQVIIGLGNVAVKTLLKTKEGITSLRGNWKTYQGIPLMPTFHPAYLLRTPSDKRLVWDDIKKVMAEMGKNK
ncbi:MAG: uracil-DNA glycosylase [Nitrospirae bacterium]|nr:uracil-DNA glycosylase [Nitrospirota bacterium]